MTDQTKISVLIPYHNSHATLAETIASVLKQGLEGLEIIIADDHSDDASRSVLDEIALKHDCIRIANVNGRGPSAARNSAAKAASGAFYYFLDADDCLRPGALAALVQFLDHNPAIGIAFGRVRITENPSVPGGIITPYCERPDLAQLIGENLVCTTSNIIVRSEAFADIGNFDQTLSHAEDQEWLARAFENKHWRLAGIDRVTLDYRTSYGGLSSDLAKMESGWRKMMKVVRRRSKTIPDPQLKKATGLFYRYLARRALRLGGTRIVGAIFVCRALVAYPMLIFYERRRTWPTLIGVLGVLLIGARPFRKALQ